MPSKDQPDKPNDLEGELNELRVAFDEFRSLLDANLEVNRTALEGTDRAINRMTWIASIAMFLITILSGGGLAFGLWSKLGLPEEARNQVATQVPVVVANHVAQAVPQAVRDDVSTQVPLVIDQLRSTVIAQVVPTAFTEIQTQAAVAAATAVQQTVGNFIIIISSDVDLEAAKVQEDQGKRQGYEPVIYKIGDYYATTIGRYSTEEQLRTDLDKVREELAPRAYSLNLEISCPYPKFFVSGFYGCFLEPQE